MADESKYPDEGEEIIVAGKFEAYVEEGYQYCKLSDAVIENGM